MTTKSDMKEKKVMSIDDIEDVEKHVKWMIDLCMEGLEWEPLDAENFHGAAKLLEKYYLNEEPAALATKISSNPVAVEEFILYAALLAHDGISLVIKDTQSKEVVACSFNKLVTRPSKDRIEDYFEVFGHKYLTQPESKAYIVDFCAKFEKINIFDKFDIECSMELVMWSVHPEYRRRNLAHVLHHYSTLAAVLLEKGPISSIDVKSLGPKYANLVLGDRVKMLPEAQHAICTSKITQEITRKHGAILVDDVPFSDIFYNGQSYEELLGTKDVNTAMLIVTPRNLWLNAYNVFFERERNI